MNTQICERLIQFKKMFEACIEIGPARFFRLRRNFKARQKTSDARNRVFYGQGSYWYGLAFRIRAAIRYTQRLF